MQIYKWWTNLCTAIPRETLLGLKTIVSYSMCSCLKNYKHGMKTFNKKIQWL